MDNPRIIHAPINNGRRYGITSPITQYDYGYLLLPEGVELPTTYEVDFSNDEHKGTSLTVYGGAEGAEVPEVLIRTGKDVFAFYYEVGEGYGKTEYTWRIPNNCRPSRDGQTPTPTQQSSIDQLIVRSNEAVEQAEQSASDASTSAQNASADAERAREARTDAQNYANNAQTSANNASVSASQASASASASAQSASEAQSASTNAETYALNSGNKAVESAQSATASANSATTAQGFAQSASASAQSASQYASSAQTSANTASNKASEASTSAQTASNKASEASQSASQALTYKTDAESAKTASQTAQGLAEQARDTAVSAKTDAESAKADAESARDEAQQAVASISGALDDKADVITDTASGAVASFSDGADDLPLKSLIVDINPIQDLSNGDPSPENICPISGHDTVEVLDDPACGGTIEWNQLVINGNMENNDGWVSAPQASGAFSVSNNILTCTMTEEAQYLNIVNWNTQWLVKGHKYLYSVNVRSSAWADSGYRAILILGGYWVQAIRTDIQAGTWVNISGIWTSTIKDAIQATFRRYPDANYSPFDVKEFMVFDLTQMFGAGNEPATVESFRALFPNDYYEYTTGEETCVSAVNGNPYRHITIPLGQTVYGGKLDVLSGDLAVYPYYASYNGETLTGEWISDRDKYVSGTTPTIGAQVVNIGAQGMTVQLEPHEVESLYGVNNIWADSGDTEIEYRADTKAYIAKKIAEAISALS